MRLFWHDGIPLKIRLHIAAALLIGAATALAYGGSLANGFTFDDHGIVEGNAAIAQLDWHRLIGDSYWSVTGATTGLYRPVTLLSFALNRWALGMEPSSFHAANLILHWAVAFALYWIATQSLPWSAGLLAGLLMATYPATAEAVNAVVGRADLLSTLIALGAVALMWPLPRDAGRWRAPAAAVVLIAAQLAKESALAVAGGLTLVALMRRRRDLHLWMLPALAAVTGVAVRLVVTGRLRPAGIGFIDNPLAYVDGTTRLANGFAIAVRYLRLLVFPWPLSADYSYAQIPVLAPWGIEVSLAAALVISLTVVSLKLALRTELGTLAWGMAAASLAMITHIAAPLGTVFAERLILLPAAVQCLLCGWALVRGARAHRLAPMVLGALWVAVGATLASARTAQWNSDLSLFQAAVTTSPRSARAHYGLGRALHRQGHLDRALDSYGDALSLYPRYAEAHYNRGAALLSLNRRAEALEAYERATSCRPGFVRARLATALITEALHGPERAERLYERVLESDPAHEEAAARLSRSCAARGEGARALEILNTALEVRPSARLARLRQALTSAQ